MRLVKRLIATFLNLLLRPFNRRVLLKLEKIRDYGPRPESGFSEGEHFDDATFSFDQLGPPRSVSPFAPQNRSYPKISIVTANYNGARYIEQTIQSVLNQNYPNLEYIVIDGGSTDGSQDIIRKYEDRLTHWESEPDRGFAHAYNKGFSKTSGEILGYINSDDVYCPWSFNIAAKVFGDLPQIEWLTTLLPMLHDSETTFVGCYPRQVINRQLFYAGYYGIELPFIQQESTFWKRSLWTRSGAFFDEKLRFAIDIDLWARFFRFVELYAVYVPLSGWRIRPDSKSQAGFNAMWTEIDGILAPHQKEYFKPLPQDRKIFGKAVVWDIHRKAYIAKSQEIRVPETQVWPSRYSDSDWKNGISLRRSRPGFFALQQKGSRFPFRVGDKLIFARSGQATVVSIDERDNPDDRWRSVFVIVDKRLSPNGDGYPESIRLWRK